MRMAITRFDPFRELAHMQDRINRIFGEQYGTGDDMLNRGDWMPPVDIFETELDLPRPDVTLGLFAIPEVIDLAIRFFWLTFAIPFNGAERFALLAFFLALISQQSRAVVRR